MYKQDIPAIVFGLFETGLGVIRSLGQKDIRVIAIDFKKDIAFFSKYAEPLICPHPLTEEDQFLQWLIDLSDKMENTILPVFFTSDVFLNVFSKNRVLLKKYFSFNLPHEQILNRIENKYEQYLLAKSSGVRVPLTYAIRSEEDLKSIDSSKLLYPVFIKGLDVLSWRSKISSSIKGFQANNIQKLYEIAKPIIKKQVPIVVQEIIEGVDTNHFKYCCYIDQTKNLLAEFTLQKIRQSPIHFGVGAVVESVNYPELEEAGRQLFQGLQYRGIGSAEFKIDDRDGQLKLIEINPRYWQQNYLSTYCGINFPYINYKDLTNKENRFYNSFSTGIKWVNPYMDFNSFWDYYKEGSISFLGWRKSLRGKKVYSDFSWKDPIPGLYEIDFGKKLLRLPYFLWKKITKKKSH